MKINLEFDDMSEMLNFARQLVGENTARKSLEPPTHTQDKVAVTLSKAPSTAASAVPEPKWEFATAPDGRKRRTKRELALHAKEKELGRLLTPEEKGETVAHVEIDQEKEDQAKEETKTKVKYEEKAADILKEVVEETVVTEEIGIIGDIFTKDETPEQKATPTNKPGDAPEIPKTEELSDLKSLFE